MSFDLLKPDLRQLKRLIYSRDHCTSCIMDERARKNPATVFEEQKMEYRHVYHHQAKKVELQRTLSHGKGSGRRLLPAGYFSLESLLLLVCLTASLLILPLILPPLPPPPFMLLLLPIGILGLLMVLAFMPSNARNIANTYV